MENPKKQEKRKETPVSPKQQDLAANKSTGFEKPMTTDQGVKINNDHDTLKAGERGPSLLEDFIMREKITHFDHERIPERVVHARGSAAHGIFEVTNPIPEYTKAKFLSEQGKTTSVFVRFSTVAGERGSTDVPRDARGFAVKFYTEEGNYDLVANNMAPFFIHDAMKFPDLVHSLKPEPRDGIPQATGAHDTFWGFLSSSPETMHMVMWLMSDRALPRSYRMMEGFGVHSFRFINARGVSSFVKFHWKPKLGMHSVVWDEAQKISGNDPDFHRRDLWDAIVADQLGLDVPQGVPENLQRGADAMPEEYETVIKRPEINDSPALSILRNNPKDSIATRKYALLCDDGVDTAELNRVKQALLDAGAMVRVVASHQGELQPAMDDITIEGVGHSVKADDSVLTTSCVLFDGLVVMNGSEQMVSALLADTRFKVFVKDTYRHHKPIAVYGNAEDFVMNAMGYDITVEEGIIKNGTPAEVIDAFKKGRFWNR